MITYGTQREDLRSELERLLGVHFEAHDSLYVGEYWLAEIEGATRLTIRLNEDLLWQQGDPEEERFALPEFAEYAVLLEVEGESPDLVEKLNGLPMLRFLATEG